MSTCLAFISSYAGRPMVVDDASLVPAHTCQLDSWMQNNPNDKEYWVIPSCNIGGNFEFGIGMAVIFLTTLAMRLIQLCKGKHS